MLFRDDAVTVVDWQTPSIGPAMRDASYFLCGGLSVEDRREHEEALVRAYHDELLAHGRHGLRLGAPAGRSTGASRSSAC